MSASPWTAELTAPGSSPQTLAPLDVVRVYQLLLHRAPESQEVIEYYLQRFHDPLDLAEALSQSTECRTKRTVVQPVYTARFDVPSLLGRFVVPNPPPRAGFVPNFVGALTDMKFLPKKRVETVIVEGVALTTNLQAEVAEWAAVLRAVSFARESLTTVELGAGWAPWVVNAALAAKHALGLKKTFGIAVEADEEHLRYAREHLQTNGFAEEETRLIHAAVGPQSGSAVFPIPEDAAADWGCRPTFVADQAAGERLLAAGDFVDYRGSTFRQARILPAISCADVLANCERVDLLHIDIQGDEADLVSDNLALLLERVNYLVIGTHSREIEGRLIAALSPQWKLEVEQPCRFVITDCGLLPQHDGVQGWRNPRLPASVA